MSAFETMTIDLGSQTSLRTDISYPAEYIDQMYFLMAVVENPSNSLLSVAMTGRNTQGIPIRPILTNGRGGSAFDVSAGAPAGAYHEFRPTIPIPLMESSWNCSGKRINFSFDVTDVNGDAVTYNRLVLYFALVKAGRERHWACPIRVTDDQIAF
jgi:hypothetical protein